MRRRRRRRMRQEPPARSIKTIGFYAFGENQNQKETRRKPIRKQTARKPPSINHCFLQVLGKSGPQQSISQDIVANVMRVMSFVWIVETIVFRYTCDKKPQPASGYRRALQTICVVGPPPKNYCSGGFSHFLGHV